MRLLRAGAQTHEIPIDDASRVGQVRRVAAQVAQRAGFDEEDTGRVALVATELATNVLKHAGRGVMQVQAIAGDGGEGVELVAIDRGAGFDYVACLADGMSTSGTRGIGLGAVQRQAQVVDLFSDARGSVVMARFFPRGGTYRDVRYGASQRALGGAPECGDGWGIAWTGAQCSVVVVDGLGHGPLAHEAANAATRAFAEAGHADPATTMDALHAAMSGTRGGAVAIAAYDAAPGTMRFAGIGNISGALHSPDGSRGLASHPGIVGVQYRRAQSFDYADAAGKLLVLHSDGVNTRWSLRDYPGLAARHPAVIAAVLMRDFDRGRDDATVVVVALGGTR